MLNKSPAVSLFVISLVCTAPAAMAASACTGLSQTACSADKACTWVGGYTRKDGAKVKDYCRMKGQKSTRTERVKGKSQG